jgi:hypothetical protein
LLDLSANAGDLLLDSQYIADFPGALQKDGLEALFGLA